MPRKARREETEVESQHGHCADVLMSDFGIPKEMRIQVCEEIAKVYKQCTMIHCIIIASVRGFQPHGATRMLEGFLGEHSTHEQCNSKASIERRSRPQGSFDSRGYYHQHDPYEDF